MDSTSTDRRMIFQLGTNNWQQNGEFAPGSGILHETHHHAYNRLPNTSSYSVFPSRVQRSSRPDVSVFELDHDIPICESISPVSSYRWHLMSDGEFSAYRRRLTDHVVNYMDEIEREQNQSFQLAIAHHAFLNPLVMRDVLQTRQQQGKPPMTLACFVHGTALKMFNHEKRGLNVDEFPSRFLPMMRDEGVFCAPADSRVGVDVCATISEQQVDTFSEVFTEFPRDRVLLSHNGYDQDVFKAQPHLYERRTEILSRFDTVPYRGSDATPRPVYTVGGYDRVVVFCGKFADWKRLDALLRAAAIYEKACDKQQLKIATLIVGSGPIEDQKRMQDLAHKELGLQHVYFLGPRPQSELAVLYNLSDVGCFPSRNEPFGLVFIEAMACGTPVIGADSGGPRDFVTNEVGVLVPESDDIGVLATHLSNAIRQSFEEDWKNSRGWTAKRIAETQFSVQKQCSDLLAAIDAQSSRTLAAV